MKCSSLVSARCAVLLTAVLVLGGACSDDQAEDVSADRGADRGANSAPAASPAVAIENFLFKPDNLTVKAGAEVPVTNGDDAAHTLTASDGSFDTGTIEPGGKATVKVPAGDHPYICSIHPYMKGVLRADA
jgi:plastocyanin